MKWAGNAAKRFASPFVDNPHDRIDVDPIILSHAAVACGYTIRDFYEKPELGIHCVGYISQLYDLLPVTHWFFSLPWVTELGLKLEYKDTLPPISTGPIISEPGEVDKIHVPDKKEIEADGHSKMFKRHLWLCSEEPRPYLGADLIRFRPSGSGRRAVRCRELHHVDLHRA